jgi:hypothetical protein
MLGVSVTDAEGITVTGVSNFDMHYMPLMEMENASLSVTLKLKINCRGVYTIALQNTTDHPVYHENGRI